MIMKCKKSVQNLNFPPLIEHAQCSAGNFSEFLGDSEKHNVARSEKAGKEDKRCDDKLPKKG